MSTVLITGASRGIGAACVRLFASKGWQVIANYKSSDKEAKALQEETGCLIYKADVSDAAAVKAMHGEIKKRGICVDALVNNAGVALFGLFQEISEEQAKAVYGTNLFGALNCSREFLPDMLSRQKGCIINLSSVWCEVGGSCETDYSASKAAIVGFTKALAKEAGFSGVRVNCVSPGIIDTDMNAALSVDEVAEIVDSIPLERLGNPEDVAEAVYFLASEKASYITGQVLCVDGGWKG